MHKQLSEFRPQSKVVLGEQQNKPPDQHENPFIKVL